MLGEVSRDQIERLVTALERISHGEEYPSGMEALCIAFSGEGLPTNGTSVADGLFAIAEAIEGLTEAIKSK